MRETLSTPETIEELRTAIATLLSTELGTFKDDSQAIQVTPPELINEKVDGILCIIERFPRLMRSQPLTNSQNLEYRYWVITFRQYNRDVIPVQTIAPIDLGAEAIAIKPLQGAIHKGARISFPSQEITVSEAVAGGAERLVLSEPAIASASAETGMHDPMTDMDSLFCKMAQRFPFKRERHLPPTEEVVYPQVSYLLDFNTTVNLSRLC
ncbi:MAG: hypothetical protein F6K65_37460 [Moorea sp. SIO3C2]|nr:hypothetical protein [Moorena sp. SIO3C2]